jgi:hypothetical protein
LIIRLEGSLLIWASARLPLRLIEGLGAFADTVADSGGGLECVQDFEQGRLVQGHRVTPFYEILGRFPQRLTRWPLPRAQTR